MVGTVRVDTGAESPGAPLGAITAADIPVLEAIQRRVLWLSTAIVHHANHGRPNDDGIKVGGHQASSASVVSLLTALYFGYLRAGDRVAVKPHASPAFHAVQYLLGRLDQSYLTRLRSFHGLQAYPSRTKDPDDVHFSLGSIGFGATATAFAALVQRYVQARFRSERRGRFVAVLGDAELDEGNVWEAVAEEHLADLGNVLWVVDLNRQSLDRVIPGIRAIQLEEQFRANHWHVIEAKYGRRLQSYFARPGGEHLRACIDEMSNESYQGLIRQPGAEIRQRLARTRNGEALLDLLADCGDDQLPSLLGDLGGHDLGELIARFAEAEAHTTSPTVLFAYTMKGWGLPFAGDPLNHAAQLTSDQMAALRLELAIGADEWQEFESGSAEAELCRRAAARLHEAAEVGTSPISPSAVPLEIGTRSAARTSSQEAFGRVLADLADRPHVGERIVTVSPDVAVSTNLGAWVNRVGVFHATPQEEVPLGGARLLRWQPGPEGRHIELGISEMNLFTLLGQLGVAGEMLDEPLLPIGTVYDPFICRGLDAYVHALYSGARFVLVATPSGITLAPEGGAHQSTVTPGLGIQLPGLIAYEPCFAREVEWTLLEALRQCCDREAGQSTYLRLSTRPIDQSLLEPALERYGSEGLCQNVLAGGYRLFDWQDSAAAVDPTTLVHIVVAGAAVPDAVEAAQQLAREGVAVNVLNVTSADRLFSGLVARRRAGVKSGIGGRDAGHLDSLIPPGERTAPMVTVLDGSSHTLSFMGGIFGVPVVPLGVDQFGQSGSRAELYQEYGIDAEHIINAALLALDLRTS